MSDFLGPMTIGADPVEDDAPDEDVVPMRVDERDAPGPSPDALEVYPDGPTEERREAARAKAVPVHIVRPMPSRPAPGRMLYAFTRTIAGNAGPVLLGLEPSVVQAQEIHYLLLTTDSSAAEVSTDEQATSSSRFRLVADAPALRFDGLAGLYVWNSGGETITVSVAVIGSAR